MGDCPERVRHISIFHAGVECAAFLINWGRRQHLRSEYAMPLLLEALLLICFGLLGEQLGKHGWLFIPLTVTVLCFIMGLQNAIIIKASNYEIRTTHVMGTVADIGIELGKLFYWNAPCADGKAGRVIANRVKLRMLSTTVLLLFIGGVSGALWFQYIDFPSTAALASLLVLLAAIPIADNVASRMRHLFSQKQ